MYVVDDAPEAKERVSKGVEAAMEALSTVDGLTIGEAMVVMESCLEALGRSVEAESLAKSSDGNPVGLLGLDKA